MKIRVRGGRRRRSGKGKGSNLGPRLGDLKFCQFGQASTLSAFGILHFTYYMIFECDFSLILKMFSLCKIIMLFLIIFYGCLKLFIEKVINLWFND